MRVEQLKEKGAIYFEKIQDGFEQYDYETKKFSAQEIEKIFVKMWKEKENIEVFVDFYYFTIEEDARKKVDEYLSEDEKRYVNNQLRREQGIIFPAKEELIKIVAKLNEKEILFSTLYITGDEKSTWWGNYGKEYVIFTEKV